MTTTHPDNTQHAAQPEGHPEAQPAVFRPIPPPARPGNGGPRPVADQPAGRPAEQPVGQVHPELPAGSSGPVSGPAGDPTAGNARMRARGAADPAATSGPADAYADPASEPGDGAGGELVERPRGALVRVAGGLAERAGKVRQNDRLRRVAGGLVPPDLIEADRPSLRAQMRHLRWGQHLADHGPVRFLGQAYGVAVAMPIHVIAHLLAWIAERPARLVLGYVAFVALVQLPGVAPVLHAVLTVLTWPVRVWL